MKRAILFALLCIFSIHAFPQGKYGFEGGIGYTTIKKSYFTPAFQAYYLARLSRTFYGGGALSLQSYSMAYRPGVPATVAGETVQLRQASSYLFFTPRMEMGIGFRKHIFANCSMGPGIYVGGHQYTDAYGLFPQSPAGPAHADTASVNTSGNIPALLFRISGGLKERFTTLGFWSIVVSEELTYLPGNLSKNGSGLKTNYFSLTVGIMHKYPQVKVEED